MAGLFSQMARQYEAFVDAQRALEAARAAVDSVTPKLRCVIRAERSIDELAAARPAFSVIPDYLPNQAVATAWERKHGESHDLMVVALGKTGYGKSTTLNRLLGEDAFETSDISGCTRKLQSVEYRFDGGDADYYCAFGDLPGLGETPELDAEYYPLYRKTLGTAHVVLYFVRADQRDYSVDLLAFKELLAAADVQKKVILVINAIDKIEPLNRSFPFVPSREQQRALEEKIETLRGIFSLPRASIAAVSGAEDYNLDALADMIMERLAPALVWA